MEREVNNAVAAYGIGKRVEVVTDGSAVCDSIEGTGRVIYRSPLNFKRYLIQEAEEPEWYSVTEAGLNLIGDNKTVGNIFYLVKTFFSTAQLEEVFSIDGEVALTRVLYCMAL